jgi:hypothetical protein
MSLLLSISALSAVEILLWVVLALLFWKKGFIYRFPAMAAFIGLRLMAASALMMVLYRLQFHRDPAFSSIYFYGYRAICVASAVLVLFVCMEVFRSAMSAFPGLLKIGIVIFRWVFLVSLILTVSSLPFPHRGLFFLSDLTGGLVRSVSVLELCLFLFLCLSMHALRLALRDIAYGIVLGFGFIAAIDLVEASPIDANALAMTGPLEIFCQALTIVTVGVWIFYCLLPARAPRPVVLPASSVIYRWNEIANALGHTGTQVAPQQSANRFFLTDVEIVVEKVLNRNLKDRKSES